MTVKACYSSPLTAISLFSGAGIGDLGIRAAGCEVLALCELEPDRLGLARTNFPQAKAFEGDIWKLSAEVVDWTKRTLDARKGDLDLLSCTAPCQGMSKSGQGTLLRNIREGRRPKLDPRNRLIIPALKTIQALRPRVCIFENVLEMRRTLIEDDHGNLVSILDLIRRELGPDYEGCAYDVEFADYGIPQRRQRLITVFTRDAHLKTALKLGNPFLPPVTHSKARRAGLKPWISVWEAIKDFPPLDASTAAKATDPQTPLHRVPLLDPLKYYWVSNTPTGKSAFDNQCVTCGFAANPVHGSSRDEKGINRANTETPLYCIECGEMLPRPSVEGSDGQRRIMSGYTSAYKRMDPTLPCPTLTRNLSYACSDQKLHPYQHRVLSLAEAVSLHSIGDYAFEWTITDSSGARTMANDGLIRLVIGESIPPRFMEHLTTYIANLLRVHEHTIPAHTQQQLFA